MSRRTSSACRRCGPNAVPLRPRAVRTCLAASRLADAFFAPIAVRLRTYRVKLSAADEAYVETLYQWPAFKAWQKAGLEEVER